MKDSNKPSATSSFSCCAPYTIPGLPIDMFPTTSRTAMIADTLRNFCFFLIFNLSPFTSSALFLGSAVLTKEEGSITWEVDVLEEGWYQLLIDYYPMSGKNGTIERELLINGEIPFDGAKYIEFTRHNIHSHF